MKIVTRHTSGGGVLRLATKGPWAFPPEALAEKIATVGEAEDRFWGEGGKPYFVSLIPLTPLTSGHASGGRGLHEAFALYAEPSAKLDAFTYLLAHERMHAWIPTSLGGFSGEKPGLDYWFSEGFTDFYAARLLLRSGVWTLNDFVAQENTVLTRYAASPVRNLPNGGIQDRFWTDPAVEQLAYDRGRLFAAVLDDRLARVSRGKLNLDDVMRRQRDLARRNEASRVEVSAAALFPVAYRQVAGASLADDIAKYIDAGATLTLPGDLYGTCATVKTITIPAFDRGFDGEKSAATGMITGVDPAGPAYAAGLRNGMKRLGREGDPDGDSRREIGYRVEGADGRDRVILYLPAGKGVLTLQQVELVPNLSAGAQLACARAMAGGPPS